ncbi:response regulator, partial [Pyxidicoccus fallax]
MGDGERKRTLEVARRVSSGGELSGRTVLIVDDDPAHVRHVRDGLAPHGYIFKEAHDGTQALSAIRQARPDLILMDVEMPGLGGVEV